MIQGYAEGLKENVAVEKKREFYCNVISEEANKMDLLIKDLLLLANLEADNNITLHKERTEINSFVKKIIEKYNLKLNEQAICIELITADAAYFEIDRLKIEQVLSNILNNAINHIDENRKIIVTLKTTDVHNMRISIFNSGKNIRKDNLEKIWGSFFREDQARTRDAGRVGLGLSIVKKILQAHKASFNVNNKLNGVEFWFELPTEAL